MKKQYEYEDYTVIIGDIIDSKDIKNRNQVQTTVKNILSTINKKYSKDIAAEFSITLGDEFQGLLKNRNNIINIISEFEMIMAPVSIRFGVGIGNVSTDINFERSAEIDGSAYHRARTMIEDLENSENQYSKRQANILISSQDKNIEIDQLLNSILSLCTALKSKWTLRQHEIIHTYLLNDENQYKTAEKLSIGQSTVSKALNAANFTTYQSAMANVNSFLTEKEKANE